MRGGRWGNLRREDREEEEEEGRRVGCILLRKECRRALVFKKPDGDGMKQRIKTE